MTFSLQADIDNSKIGGKNLLFLFLEIYCGFHMIYCMYCYRRLFGGNNGRQ